MNTALIRSIALLAAVTVGGAATAAAPAAVPEFRKLDRNGDGKISLAEIKGNADLELKFESLDRNRDGFLSADEYGSAVKPVDPSTAPGGSAGAQHMPRN